MTLEAEILPDQPPMGPDSMAMAQQEDRLKVSTTYVVRISHRVLLPPLVSAMSA